LGRTFLDTESHYVASEATAIDSAVIESAIKKIVRKGFGTHTGSRILVLANPDQAEDVMAWRAGHESRAPEGSETDDDVPLCKYDFIPAVDAPPFLTPAGELVGEQVPGEWGGVKIEGSYGPSVLVQSDFIPSGFLLVAASYGPNSQYNVVGFREHENPQYQGLRHIAGPGQYPLTESFSTRGFGCAVRQRGAAVAIMLGDDTYAAPSDSQIPI
jgi:hypothetical protein